MQSHFHHCPPTPLARQTADTVGSAAGVTPSLLLHDKEKVRGNCSGSCAVSAHVKSSAKASGSGCKASAAFTCRLKTPTDTSTNGLSKNISRPIQLFPPSFGMALNC